MKFVCFGDSITSEEVSGIGTLICRALGAELVGNFAHGNATCADWHKGGICLTRPCLHVPADHWGGENTLSNQIRSYLAGRIRADVFYIAIGANDGKDGPDGCTPVADDTRVRFSGGADDRMSICGALLWACGQLRAAAPGAEIFIATPLKARGDQLPDAFSPEMLLSKRAILTKTAAHLGVHLIDSYARSPFTGRDGADALGIHPVGAMRQRIADFCAREIQSALNRV